MDYSLLLVVEKINVDDFTTSHGSLNFDADESK